MRKIESFSDDMNGKVTYELDDGRFAKFDRAEVREYGLASLLKHLGVEPPTERRPVMQSGRKIGSVPGDFDPLSIKSTTFLCDPRPGDFRQTRYGWIAADSLGPGDLEAVPGFVWERGTSR